MKDIEVKYLQQTLNEKGYAIAKTGAGAKGLETTYFGNATKTAVKTYQKAKGLVADGIFGAKSRATLGSTFPPVITNYPPVGCSQNAIFNTLTGARCDGTTAINYPAGCYGTSGFSTLTGARCDGTVFTPPVVVGGGGSSGGGGGGGGGNPIVTNTAPVVSISSPVNNTVFNAGSNLTIQAIATDVDNNLTKVEFYNGATKLGEDTSSPYTYTWTSVPAGTYSLTAKAMDSSNAVTISNIINATARVGAPLPNSAPTVSITSPANNSSYTTPASITINATASDTDGTVSKVEFYNGATKLGEDTSSPYTYTWTNVSAGTYSLNAKATDDDGATTTSNTINVTVSTVTPPVTPRPDLIADVITSETVTAGTGRTFYSYITNQGTATTGTVSLNTLFQFDEDTDHTSVASSSISKNSTSLAMGGNFRAARPYTFTTAGTRYIRACADSDLSFASTISELNENNNCGPWTTITVNAATPEDPPPTNDNTYYISYSSGNDSNTGTSSSTPWKTLQKVNSMTFQPGDNILFKSGDVWEDGTGTPLIIKSPGTANKYITYGSYGNGNKPVISMWSDLPGWQDNARWTKYANAYSNDVWVMTFPLSASGTQLGRLWVNNGSGVRELWIGNENSSITSPTDDVVLPYDNLDGTFFVNSTHEFAYDSGSKKLFLYSPNGIKPSDYYTQIKYVGQVSQTNGIQYNSHVFAVEVIADYIVIDGLDMQAGFYGSLGLAGADNIIIRNNSIGNKGKFAAIAAQNSIMSYFNSDKTSDDVEIYNNEIDSHYPFPFHLQHSYYALVAYGISLVNTKGGMDSWDIHDNHIKDWAVGLLVINNGSNYADANHKFHHNEVEMVNIAYTKPFQIEGTNTNIEVYNNIFHGYNIHAQVSANGNKIYYNIFKNAPNVLNAHDSSGDGIDFNGSPTNNAIFNNTFYDIYDRPLRFMNQVQILNNLFVNTGQRYSGVNPIIIGISNLTFKNNMLYYNGLTASDTILYNNSAANMRYTFSSYELLNGTNNLFASGNKLHLGTMQQLINSDLTIPSDSPAIDGGTNICSLLPSGFTDKNGTSVNCATPTVGALEYQSVSSLDNINLLANTSNTDEMLTDFSNKIIELSSNVYNFLVFYIVNLYTSIF